MSADLRNREHREQDARQRWVDEDIAYARNRAWEMPPQDFIEEKTKRDIALSRPTDADLADEERTEGHLLPLKYKNIHD